MYPARYKEGRADNLFAMVSFLQRPAEECPALPPPTWRGAVAWD